MISNPRRSPADSDPLRVALFAPFFAPGYKSGGPIRSLNALTVRDQSRVHFYVVTSDREPGDSQPYGIAQNPGWVRQGARDVRYVNGSSPARYMRAVLAVRRISPDVYYFNSLWSSRSTLLPIFFILCRVLPWRRVVWAPRGQVLQGALGSKRWKKRLAMLYVRSSVAILKPTFHCTSDEEQRAVRRHFSARVIVLTSDTFLTEKPELAEHSDRQPCEDIDSRLRILYLSRIHPHKNLLTLLRACSLITTRTHLRVVGPVADEAYVSQCRTLASSLPDNVTVEFVGPVPHEKVAAYYSWAHIFVLPTRSENFGHAIREALSAGCVVLTAPGTPWSILLTSIGLPPIPHDDWQEYGARLAALGATPDKLASLADVSRQAYRTWEIAARASAQDVEDVLLAEGAVRWQHRTGVRVTGGHRA